MGYYLALNKNEVLMHVTIQMTLEKQAFKLHGSIYMWAFSLNLHYSATQSGIN